MTTDVLAMAHVPVGKFLRRGQRQHLLLGDRLTGAHRLAHALDRIDRVHGGGSRSLESFANGFNLPPELRQVASTEGADALGESVGGRGGNRAGSAHDHVLDGPRRLAEIARRDDPEFVGQEPLFDKQDGIVPGVKCHCPKMSGTAVEGNIQAISTLIFRILLSMLR